MKRNKRTSILETPKSLQSQYNKAMALYSQAVATGKNEDESEKIFRIAMGYEVK